jgi:hypothetical protein
LLGGVEVNVIVWGLLLTGRTSLVWAELAGALSPPALLAVS